jgi:hypothetical protein
MSTPIKIGYYRIINAATGVVIWPQLVSTDNPSTDVLWDGRHAAESFVTPSGMSRRMVLNIDSTT